MDLVDIPTCKGESSGLGNQLPELFGKVDRKSNWKLNTVKNVGAPIYTLVVEIESGWDDATMAFHFLNHGRSQSLGKDRSRILLVVVCVSSLHSVQEIDSTEAATLNKWVCLSIRASAIAFITSSLAAIPFNDRAIWSRLWYPRPWNETA